MINPNKSYKTKELARIVKIEPPTAYIPYITVKTDSGRTISGRLSRVYSKPEQLKVGDLVGFEVQFSIVGDEFMLSKIIRKRGVK